jgi:diacylglycerol kinase family enzyme
VWNSSNFTGAENTRGMKKVVLIANPKAGGMGSGLVDQAAAALVGDFSLEVSETSGRDAGTRLAHEALAGGADAVAVLGGDGTVNEVAQALVNSDAALGIIPAGTTNVMARAIGIPEDVTEASRYLAARIDANSRTRINVGRIEDRYFLFGAGMGLDAEVIRLVEERPDRKQKFGHFFFLKEALATARRHRGAEPTIAMTVDGGRQEMVLLALIANAGPFTYFGSRPLHVFPYVRLHEGLDAFGLSRLGRGTVPRLAWAFFVSRSHVRWSNSSYFHDVQTVELRAGSHLPVEVDGDYIGEWDHVTISLVPHALDLLM